ncbi:MAG: nucleotide sugar dehydrogenase [Planctomycetes bacterium]|nr:nucleotide sugar dehydrogenase [Planctomycetota bacterium]
MSQQTASAGAEALAAKIAGRKACVGIIGLGYVGLPLANAFSAAGFSVLGFDIDARKIEALRKGESYIRQIPDDMIRGMRDRGFEGTADFERLRAADAILICVPTPLTKTMDPDMQYIVGTAEAILPRLRAGQLIVLESTTYPGTTDEVVRPILERSGLRAGEDFFLAFSPEREDPGNKRFNTRTIPKVVGGIDERSGKLAADLYGSAVVRVVTVSSARAAEAVKILENIYRCVNIALVNELKMLFDRMGIDVWEVIRAASTKPFGFHPFWPGPGLGGHCIPIDPFYLSWKAREFGFRTRFIELAGEVNTGMPAYVVQRLMETLNARGRSLKGSRILVLGIAYKPDIDDPRESPAMEVIHLLVRRGAVVEYHDPFIPVMPHMRSWEDLPALESVPLDEAHVRGADAVLIATNHSAVDYGWIVRTANLVVDTRDATADVRESREKIVKA